MTFNEAIVSIVDILSRAGTTIKADNYDGIIVKKLAKSNTLDTGRTKTGQTHLAITGEQMGIFPCLSIEGYTHGKNGSVIGKDLKKYFVLSAPVILYESNFKYLKYIGNDIPFVDGMIRTAATIVRSKRDNSNDQLQVSMLDMDGIHFVAFRRLLHEGSYFILLKHRESMCYDVFGIDPQLNTEDTPVLSQMNNKFFRDDTNTAVDANAIMLVPDIEVVADNIPDNLSIEELGAILKQMYEDPNASSQTNAIRMFAIKYGRVIEENGYTANAITTASGIKESYYTELSKGINIYKSIKNNEYGIRFFEGNETDPGTDVNPTSPVFSPRTDKTHPLNCILYGAPGTGKTYATAEYALAILENRKVDMAAKTPEQRKEIMEQYRTHVGNERIVFTTFHQSYGYEDFIQGLRPVSANGGTDFVPVDGVFKRIADTAMKHPEDNYVIIIDEINRANISKVFGELITLIEDDKRWGEVNALQVTLPSGDSFKIPNNLYIVGTMNSADKSISLIDTALRRRFEFIEVTPNASLIADPVLRSTLEKLNTSLAKELDSTDLLVGHAYFIGKTEDDLCSIFNRSIIPLLYEYFYDNSTKVKAQIKNALPNDQYEITGGTVGRIKISKK